jgi:hypothetical protein
LSGCAHAEVDAPGCDVVPLASCVIEMLSMLCPVRCNMGCDGKAITSTTTTTTETGNPFCVEGGETKECAQLEGLCSLAVIATVCPSTCGLCPDSAGCEVEECPACSTNEVPVYWNDPDG